MPSSKRPHPSKTKAKAAGRILARIHERKRTGVTGTVLAVCDEELLGKVFTQGEAVLDLKSYRQFYEGSVVSEIQAIEMLKNAENASIVGERSVEIAQKALGLSKSHAKKIGGVPHLQVYRV